MLRDWAVGGASRKEGGKARAAEDRAERAGPGVFETGSARSGRRWRHTERGLREAEARRQRECQD